MPYQGPNGYIPPGHYGSQGGRGFPQMHQSSGQQQQAPMQNAPQRLPQYQNFDQAMYGGNQTQYSTPLFYEQGPSASFYQTPAAQYQQNLYLAPPAQTAQIPQARYSPDPLQYYQVPPQPRVATPTQVRPQQHHPPPQRAPSNSQRLTSQNQPGPNFQQQRPRYHAAPNFGTGQQNVAAVINNSQMPAQRQRPPSQSRPVSGGGVSTGTSAQRQTPQIIQRPSSQQRTPSESARPPSVQAPQRSVSQASHHQPQNSPLQPQNYQSTPPGTINPNAMHHKVAHVQLPPQRMMRIEDESTMPRPVKRRRSNEGQAVPVCVSQQSTGMGRHVKQEPPASSPLTELTSSQMPPTPTPANLNYQAALLGLCDEYISAAYSMSVGLATAEVSEDDLDKYHGLLSTGMGCLDSVLRNYHISDPRLEARIRLRLASLLYEETENDMDAEEVLTKGISICERARLQDLKYAMHHLLARVWIKGRKVKTAMKAVDKLIGEVEKLKLVHWIYTFRFLRVTLGVQTEVSIAETAALVRNLSAIGETSNYHGHVSVQIMASLLEALIHLRSRIPESVDLAQRALATARMHQLSPAMTSMPRFKCLLDFVDLSCSLIRFNHDQVNAKSEIMQQELDLSVRNASWGKDCSWQVSFGKIPSSAIDVEADTGGILKQSETGECVFTFRWLTRPQIHTLGYFLAGLASMNKNASHEQKAEAYLNEAAKLAKRPLEHVAQSLPAASSLSRANNLLRVSLGLYAAFACCGRCDWDKALRGIANIRKNIEALESPPSGHITSLISYIEALCKHGLGDLPGALVLYHAPELKTETIDAKAAAGSVDPIRVLAALNSILIMRHGGDGQAADELLTEVQNACLTNPNSNGNEYGSKPIEAAFFILKATEDPYKSTDNMILKTKQYLQSAVQAARGAVNNQLLCIIMNLMTDLFFTNIVGDQAEKSAKAARSLATKSQDKLWTAVADHMYGNTLEKAGHIPQARQVREEAEDAMQRLPESLKVALLRDQMQGE